MKLRSAMLLASLGISQETLPEGKPFTYSNDNITIECTPMQIHRSSLKGGRSFSTYAITIFLTEGDVYYPDITGCRVGDFLDMIADMIVKAMERGKSKQVFDMLLEKYYGTK